jgi:drug/metabolite transporter (DMT)-like permease
MISRVVVSFAAVAASVGLLLFGMGHSYNPKNEGLETWGLVMMFGGLIVLGVGIVWYKKTEDAEEAAVEAEIRRRAS